MDDAYQDEYRRLYEGHWWWRARERFVYGILSRLSEGRAWSAILDVGCGDGLFFPKLRQLADRVDGVEADRRAVTEAGTQYGTIHIGEFGSGFEPAVRYSAILMLDVLEHMDDPTGALRHARSLLAPGGVIVVTVPALAVLWTRHDVLNHHRIRFNRQGLSRLAVSAGLQVRELRYFFHWLFFAKLAQRGFERLFAGEPQPPRIPPSTLNRALFGISLAEERVVGRWDVPWGSSLLMICTAPE